MDRDSNYIAVGAFVLLVIAMGVVDNLGKGAAGQALQNVNLICGLPENAGLDGVPMWP